MLQKIAEKVEVGMSNVPRWIKWKNRVYKIERIGLHHTYREGRTLYHIFSVAAPTLFFRLRLNTESLSWKLEEISDGLPS
ncbi:MAG TPA: hypothetical protein VJ227_04865 [Patescibacteria group bacterium]|nr:hypothetical protein [Patescibacteria group bacterium]